MGIFRSLSGTVQLELTSADVPGALLQINTAGIEIWEVQTVGELTVRFTARRKNLHALEEMAHRKGERLQIIHRSGTYWHIRNLRLRPVLLTTLLILLMLTLTLPSRVLLVEVEGADQVADNLILESARSAGIRFGASRRQVRSEKVKNSLLESLPQLQWAGVNTYGCRAVISVRERANEEEARQYTGVSSIVAGNDGVITSCTATAGNLLCSEGQAVTKGQVLISGYIDCGQKLTVTRAQGEIFARTQHDLTVKTLSEDIVRLAPKEEIHNFSLCIGKKRINFMKGSGIYDASCVKMCTEYDLALPGGYRLPVTLIKETVRHYTVQPRVRDEKHACSLLSEFAASYLCQQMVALNVEHAQEEFAATDGVYTLYGRYACTEMIGRERSEQIGDFHGKTD